MYRTFLNMTRVHPILGNVGNRVRLLTQLQQETDVQIQLCQKNHNQSETAALYTDNDITEQRSHVKVLS